MTVEDVIARLADHLSIEIGVNYMPDEISQCGGALVALYQARSIGPVSENVDHAIRTIEEAIVVSPHYRCSGCQSVFDETESKHCPVCGLDGIQSQNAQTLSPRS
jgi:hypothetical protein